MWAYSDGSVTPRALRASTTFLTSSLVGPTTQWSVVPNTVRAQRPIWWRSSYFPTLPSAVTPAG